jgi:hypothetical protein
MTDVEALLLDLPCPGDEPTGERAVLRRGFNENVHDIACYKRPIRIVL